MQYTHGSSHHFGILFNDGMCGGCGENAADCLPVVQIHVLLFGCCLYGGFYNIVEKLLDGLNTVSSYSRVNDLWMTFLSLPFCHYLSVTTFLSLPFCHYLSVTTFLSLPFCHYLSVTTFLSLPFCHYLSVTIPLFFLRLLSCDGFPSCRTRNP